MGGACVLALASSRHGASVRLAAVRLDEAPPPSDGPVWIQVAAEGEYRGHSSGPFRFSAEVFDEIVRNFRAHPSYRPGADGRGAEGVVAYDFHHASEGSPSSVAVAGAPAAAWALDLEVRQGVDGAELWALTQYLEPARSYVREGKYKWTSVAVWPDAVDPVSGERIGWYLSSIAFTNDPFIQGMTPIAAERAGRGIKASGHEAAEEVVSSLRDLFALTPTATLEDVLASVYRFRAIAKGEADAPGVCVSDLLNRLRSILNLPTLSTTDEVFAEVDKLLAALAADETPNAALAARGTAMDIKVLLAKMHGLPATAADHEILIACEADKGAMDKLGAILSALGVPDVGAAQAKIAEQFKAVADLEAAMPELAALREYKAKADEVAAEGEVDAAMAAHRMPPTARPALLAFRKSDAAAFAKQYPASKTPPALAHLQRPLATQPALTGPLASLTLNAQGQLVQAAAAPPPAPGGDGAVDLRSYPGRNVHEKAMAFVRGNGGKDLSFEACHVEASKLLAKHRAMGAPLTA